MGITVRDKMSPNWWQMSLVFGGIILAFGLMFYMFGQLDKEYAESISKMQYNVVYSNYLGREVFQCQAYKHCDNLWQFIDKNGMIIREIDKPSTYSISIEINPYYRKAEK